MHLVCKHFNKNLALHILVYLVFFFVSIFSFNRNLTLEEMKVKGKKKDDELNDNR